MKDEYVKRYMKVCTIDIVKFNEKYIIYIFPSRFFNPLSTSDNLESHAITAKRLLDELILCFQMPRGWEDPASINRTWKFVKYFIRACRDEWDVDILEKKGHEKYNQHDNLWFYFKRWFCIRLIGAFIVKELH